MKKMEITKAQARWLYFHLRNGTDGCHLGGKTNREMCDRIIRELEKVV